MIGNNYCFGSKSRFEYLIVVEGFTGVWWLVQKGLSNSLATIGGGLF